MEGRGIMSPQRSRFSPKVTKKGSSDAKKIAKKHPRNADGSKAQVAGRPNTIALPASNLKPPGAATNPNPDDHKTKFRSEPSSPASPLTLTPTPKEKNRPTTPPNFIPYHYDQSPRASPNTPGLGRQKDVNTANDLSDHLLQRLSFDGKDLGDILKGKSIYDLISPNKKAESSSSQSIDGSTVFEILKEISVHRQENLSIEQYYGKLQALWKELASYSNDLVRCSKDGAIQNLGELTEKEKVVQFLVGLDDSYATISSQILVMNPFPTVEKAYSEIIGEENRRELVVALETVAAKVIQNNWLLRNQNSRRSINGDKSFGIDQELDNTDLASPT